MDQLMNTRRKSQQSSFDNASIFDCPAAFPEPHDPTPEEIEAACHRIQKFWSDEERERRETRARYSCRFDNPRKLFSTRLRGVLGN